MSQLGQNRDLNTSPEQHLADHLALHEQHDAFDGTTPESFEAAGTTAQLAAQLGTASRAQVVDLNAVAQAAADAALAAAKAYTDSQIGGSPATVPGAPTIGTATPSATQISQVFTAPGSDGGAAIIDYTAYAVSSNGGTAGQATGASSPILIPGLTAGKDYTVTLKARNTVGQSAASGPSSSVTIPSTGTFSYTQPFASSSAWNTPFTETTYYDHACLHNFNSAIEGGSGIRIYGCNDTALGLWVKAPGDTTVWTFNLPAHSGDSWFPWRNKAAANFTRVGPAGMVAGTDSDHILVLVDPITGDYVEVWLAVVDTVNHTVTGTEWQVGNAITDSGFPTSIRSGGTRAADFSWLAGPLTIDDWNANTIDHALAIALPNAMLYGTGGGQPIHGTVNGASGLTPTNANAIDPAYGYDNGYGHAGPIRCGSRLVIPHGITMPTILNQSFGGKTPGKAVWDAFQIYGAFVGDFVGSVYPCIYTDGGESGRYNHEWNPIIPGSSGTKFTANTYDGATTYARGETVIYSGNWYTSQADSNTGHTPNVSSQWAVLGRPPAALDVIQPYLRVLDYQPS